MYDAGGDLTRTYPVDYVALTMSSTGELAAWADPRSRVQVLESGSPAPVELARMPLPGEADAGRRRGGRLGLRLRGLPRPRSDGTATTSQVDAHGVRDAGADRCCGSPTSARTSGPGRSPSRPRPTGSTAASGLYDVAGATVTAVSCKTSSLQFSPDGEHLVGGFYENNMASAVTVLDLDLGRS